MEIKNRKLVSVVLTVLVIIGTVAFTNDSEFFQGKLKKFTPIKNSIELKSKTIKKIPITTPWKIKLKEDALSPITVNLNRDLHTELQVGNKVNLPNNMSVEITSLDYNRLGVSVSTLNLINGLPPSEFEPDGKKFIHYLQTENGWNESMGYRIELVDYDFANRRATVNFQVLTPFLRSLQDLYNECLRAGNNQARCSHLLAKMPSDTDHLVETRNSRIIFPADHGNVEANDIATQTEVCYRNLPTILGYTFNEPITIRAIENFSGGYWDGYELFVNFRGDDYVSQNGQEEYNNRCYNGLLSHEMTHALLTDIGISSILHEGIATYMAYSTNARHNQLVCNENGYILYDQEEREYSPINLYNQVPENDPRGNDGNHLYFVSACFWQEFIEDHGEQQLMNLFRLLKEHEDEYIESLLEFVEDQLRIDTDVYDRKYGINYTGENEEFRLSADRVYSNNFIGVSKNPWVR